MAGTAGLACLAGTARAELSSPRGTTAGLTSPNPSWSAGIALGNEGGTGVVVQTVGVRDGAVNAGLGLGGRSIAVHGDYILFLGEGFAPVKVTKSPGYNAVRGRFFPYVGGGLAVGRGVALRVPAGIQYAMLKDPFNFFGGLTLILGNFLADDDLGIRLGVVVGARVLL